MPNGLTVIAALRPGAERTLRPILRAIGDDVAGRRVAGSDRPHIDFTRSQTIHFARFAILDDPDRGPGRARLLFSSNYDGTLDGHLAEIVAITSDMAAIWGGCEGYTDTAGFPAFVRARAHDPLAFYMAFRRESVASIRNAIDARRRAHRPPAETQSAASNDRLSLSARRTPGGPTGLLARGADVLRRAVRALPIVVDVVRAVVRYGVGGTVRATLAVIASLDRYPAFRIVNRITGNRMPPRRSPYSSVALDVCADRAMPGGPGDAPPSFREDVIAQNQLTLVTPVGPDQAPRVKAVMAAIDSYARRLAPPGSLVGVSTIHFVRWLLIDDDRRLVLLSDYDGSWEHYIDEFAEMILSGLDAIWGGTPGYPPDGARDLPAFKRFLRTHQVASEVFYSAYPDATLLNIIKDLSLVGGGTEGRGGREGRGGTEK